MLRQGFRYVRKYNPPATNSLKKVGGLAVRFALCVPGGFFASDLSPKISLAAGLVVVYNLARLWIKKICFVPTIG